jgi:chorismate dehydratase
VLTKIIFREFLGFEPEWRDARPDIDAMLAESDAALLIGDPALRINAASGRNASVNQRVAVIGRRDTLAHARVSARVFDLAELWHRYTGFGFVFAMWMTRRESVSIDFAAARDEGLGHIDEIIANYETDIQIGTGEMRKYLSENISYSIDDSMRSGMELYFKLAAKNGLIDENKPMSFVNGSEPPA